MEYLCSISKNRKIKAILLFHRKTRINPVYGWGWVRWHLKKAVNTTTKTVWTLGPLLGTLNCVPHNSCWSPNHPPPQSSKVKWDDKGETLTWSDWWPSKTRKREREIPPSPTKCEDTVRRQPSASQEESPHQKLTLLDLHLRLLASRLWEKTFLLFKPPSLWYFVWQPSWLIHPSFTTQNNIRQCHITIAVIFENSEKTKELSKDRRFENKNNFFKG